MKKINTQANDKGYTASNLSKGEKVVFTTGISKWHWVGISTVGLLSIIGYGWTMSSSSIWTQVPGLMVSTLFLIATLNGIISQYTTEYVVTNKKVVAKTGWISRKTDELLIKKTEGLDVEQGIVQRMLGYGTVQFSGTGSQKVTFFLIDNPMNAKKQLENLI